MNAYIICAVRNANPARVAEIRAYAEKLRAEGHHVHFPPDDAPQEDPGMAYALGVKIVPVFCEQPDGPEKSYWKVMCACA